MIMWKCNLTSETMELSLNTKSFLLNVILAAMCLSASATATETLSFEPVPFDKALYAAYLGAAVENVPDLISVFESRQYSILPIVMPDPDFIHLQDGGLLPFDLAAFPKRFVKRLIPVDEHGITVYPVTIMEIPDSGERQILNAAGDVIAEIAAPKDYDPLWYVRLRFPDLSKMDAETAAWQVALYDPSRIMVRFRLITEDELINKVMAESLTAQQSLTELTFSPLSLSYPATGLAFDALTVQTNGTVDVSMSWPSGTLTTEGLDIFSCTNLMEQQWSILLTTNVNNAAGSFAFNAPSAGTGGKYFLDAWTHYDGDGDGLYDGREVRLYWTDRFDADTDGDGMPDGWELQHGFDPLDAADALGDADSDGLTNIGEYQAGTDPHNSDTDGDGMPDGWEVQFGLNPLDAGDAEDDTDGDGYLNIYELKHGGEPDNAASVPSATVVVTHGQSTIQAGINAAGDYDIVRVGPGTYTGVGNRDLNFGGKRITLVSQDGAAATIIDAQNSGRGFTFTSGETRRAVVAGVTIMNGNSFATNLWQQQGGGIYCSNASPTILNSSIVSSRAYYGGGVYAWKSSPVIRNSALSGNTAQIYGGGLYSGLDSAPVVENSELVGNTAGVLGGGISCCSNSTAQISACTIQDNLAKTGGGGLYAGDAAAPILTGVSLTGNRAGNGGGLYITHTASPVVYASQVYANSATGSLGGGVYMDSSASLQMANTVISSNSASFGAGFMLQGASVLSLANSVIFTNHYTGTGDNFAGAICAYSSAAGTVRNTIIWGNTQAYYGPVYPTTSPLSITYSDVQGGYSGTGNINSAPQFTRLGFRLASGSPCIGAGTATGAPALDIDGEPNSPASIGIDAFVDTDSDNLADIWEFEHFGSLAQSGTSDPDGDTLSNQIEYEISTDPTANADADGDGLSDDAEIYYGTDPHNWDSDGDLMPDGWEVQNSLDPLNAGDAAGNSDGDGLTNFQEMQHGTNPFESDTDGDGVSDSDEVSQGSDPADADDQGDASYCLQLALVIGDHSGSHSERYALQVGHVNHVAPDFGVVSTGTYSFIKGKSYPFNVRWIATDEPTPDYDYTARVGGLPAGGSSSPSMSGSGFTVLDPEGILGVHGESTNDFAAGKSGTLNIDGPANSAAETVNADASLANTIDPINVMNGNVTLTETDIVLPAPGLPLAFSRYYNSREGQNLSGLGDGWRHSYDMQLTVRANANYKGQVGFWRVLSTPDGQSLWFRRSAGNWLSAPDNPLKLVSADPYLRVESPGGLSHMFDTNGLLRSITDAFSNTVTLTYSGTWPAQTLSRVQHTKGQYLDFVHSGGKLASISTPSTNLSLSLSYNPTGWLTNAVRHVSGANEPFAYRYETTTGVLTQRVNAAGHRFDYGYEINPPVGGPRGTSMQLDGYYYAHTIGYTATNQSQVTYQRDGQQRQFQYNFNPEQMAIQAIYGPNGTNLGTEFTRDTGMNILTQKVFDATIGETLLTARTYDARNNILTESIGYNQPPATQHWQYAWHPDLNLPTSITDPSGHRTEFSYTNGLLAVTREYPATNLTVETRFSYTTDGLLAAVTNANGHWSRFYYSSQGLVTNSVAQTGPTVNYAYNTLGHLTSLTLPGASGTRTTTLIPDGLGRISSITYPGSLGESFAYDKMGNMTNHVDTAGRTTRFTYAPAGKLTSVTRGSGAETATVRFDYDQQFNTLAIKDALNREVETYTLDIQDRPVTISNVESQTMSVVYGVGDMVKSVTRFDGTTVSNSYDGQARLTGVSWPDLSTAFTYYDNALLKTVASESGTVSNTYDQAYRLISVSSALSAFSVVNSYSLDNVGNPTNILVSIDSSPVLLNTYTFDAAERVSVINGTGGTFAFSYGQYNGLVAGVSNSMSGIRAEYNFDNLDRLTNIVWRNAASGVLRSFGYGYNSAGMITNVTRETAAENIAYQYDSLDRLTSATASYITASYGWDLAGNPSSRTENGTNTTYTLGTGNKLASWTGGSYGHDNAGCVTNITRASKTLSLAWDGRYNLTSVSTNGVIAEEYAYDPLGRRVMTVANGVTNHHIYEGAHCVADLDENGDLLRSYQPGPGVDNWLSMTVHSNGTPVVYYYLTDHVGTVHAVANENGDIVESYRYDPWGRVLGVWDANGQPLTESAIGNRILWQGREYSWSTGLYFFRSRYYDPQTARWLSRDKIGISGGMNLYQAFSGNPVMFRDPFGLWSASDLDLYGSMSDMATAGYNRGGISGSVQANFYSGMTALLDVIGGGGVQSTASKSGAAAGEGRTGAAIGWGAASAGLVALNAYSGGQSASALGKLGTYSKSPILYEIGAKTLPTSLYDDLGLAGMSQIQKGAVITEKLYHGSKLAAFLKPVATTAYGKTIWTGLTPGGAYLLNWVTAGVNSHADDRCK